MTSWLQFHGPQLGKHAQGHLKWERAKENDISFAPIQTTLAYELRRHTILLPLGSIMEKIHVELRCNYPLMEAPLC